MKILHYVTLQFAIDPLFMDINGFFFVSVPYGLCTRFLLMCVTSLSVLSSQVIKSISKIRLSFEQIYLTCS